MATSRHVAEDRTALAVQEHQTLSPVNVLHGIVPPAVSPPPVRAAQPQVVSIAVDPAIGGLLNNRLMVIGLLAVVGPLGLPALWFSPRFSRVTKILTTSLFLLVTVVLPLAFAYYWLEIALRPLVDAFGQVHQ